MTKSYVPDTIWVISGPKFKDDALVVYTPEEADGIAKVTKCHVDCFVRRPEPHKFTDPLKAGGRFALPKSLKPKRKRK